jgi:hypothetical protein
MKKSTGSYAKVFEMMRKHPMSTAKQLSRLARVPVGTASGACSKLKEAGLAIVIDNAGPYSSARYNAVSMPADSLTDSFEVEEVTVIHLKEGRLEIGPGETDDLVQVRAVKHNVTHVRDSVIDDEPITLERFEDAPSRSAVLRSLSMTWQCRSVESGTT